MGRFKNWRNSGSRSHSREQSNDSIFYGHHANNRISKDRFGNELSRISGRADQMSSLDEQDIDDMESCRLTVMGDTSVIRTEAS